MSVFRKASSCALAVALAVAVISWTPAWAAQAPLPADVPNVYDPVVRAGFVPVLVTNLRGNPDFPLVLMVNTTGHQPGALLLGLDARNGTPTWSLTGDPIVLIVTLADEAIQEVYVDLGFVGQGAPSGTYVTVDDANAGELPELLDAVPLTATQTYI
jgi:hypothetical protein